MKGNHMTKKKDTAKKKPTEKKNKPKTTKKTEQAPPEEIKLTGKDLERYHNLLEELEAVCRHYAETDSKKKIEMAVFNEQLTAINKRKEGILKDIDNLKRPLPLFDEPGPPVKFCDWSGCKDPEQAGSTYCKKHDEESTKLRKAAASKDKKSGKKKTNSKKK